MCITGFIVISKTLQLAVCILAFQQSLMGGGLGVVQAAAFVPLSIISPTAEMSSGNDNSADPCGNPNSAYYSPTLCSGESSEYPNGYNFDDEVSASEEPTMEDTEIIADGPQKRRYEFMRLGKRNPDLEKRRYEFMRLGRSSPDKRRYEFMRLGKRRYEFMRLGKRRYEFMRLGKRGQK